MRFAPLIVSGLLASASLPSTAVAQVTVQIQPTAEQPVVAISVSESVKSAPDVATINAGVQITAPTASDAQNQNSVKMEKVVAAIQARGIAAKDIQTAGISMNAQYDYTPQQTGQPPKFIGYQVNNSVRVTTRDLSKIGQLLDALVAAGSTSFDGPYFSIEKAAELAKQARANALKAADARAKEYASRLGFSRARLLVVTEGGPSYAGVGEALMITATSGGGGAPPPPPPPPVMAPGQMATGVTLTLHYQLER